MTAEAAETPAASAPAPAAGGEAAPAAPGAHAEDRWQTEERRRDAYRVG